jgi:hypothetical protein
MAKQSIEAPVVKVNHNAVNAIAGAIKSGLDTVNKSGSLLYTVCKVAQSMYRGKPIPKVDVAAILNDLVQRMGWKGATADVRRSEYKSVLSGYNTLGEAMETYRSLKGACTWNDGIALSRLLKSNAPNKAARMHAKRGNGSQSAVPKSRGDAKALAAKAIKRVLKLPKLEGGFLQALRDLCSEYSINV